MPKIEASAIERYQNVLQKDPTSQVFAPLAEAYREMGLLKEAEQVALTGVKRHPSFAAGLVVYARILKDLNRLEECLKYAQKAIDLSPENIVAHQLQAEASLLSKRPKEALKAFKMVLFLNPNSERARKAVAKLESLTADEYEDEVFEMSKIASLKEQFWTPGGVHAGSDGRSRGAGAAGSRTAASANPASTNDGEETRGGGAPRAAAGSGGGTARASGKNASPPRALERMLSLIDAFIVRHDLAKAKLLLSDTQAEFGDHPEIVQRTKLLHSRSGAMMAAPNDEESATPLKPLVSREKAIAQRKLEVLEMMLRRIDEYRQL
jgi:tetratricopeptide (TPR) repeat protein